MNAGDLDRRIQFRRGSVSDDGLTGGLRWNDADPVTDNHGSPVWASRKDVSDGERAAAGWIEATIVSRFVVRSSAFTRGLTAKDRIHTEGLAYDIQGIKQLDRRGFLEITAIARADR